MTDFDWLDEIIDGELKAAEFWQIGYIDNLLQYTSLSQSEQEKIRMELEELTEIEADKIIIYLKENEIKTDPKDQYDQMRKAGVFSSRCL